VESVVPDAHPAAETRGQCVTWRRAAAAAAAGAGQQTHDRRDDVRLGIQMSLGLEG
jgi:hypothetical protein